MKTPTKLGKIIVILCIITLVFCSSAAFASGSMITYDGNAKKFVFVPDNTDLFSDFKGVMPGDVLTQRIGIKNKVSKNDGVKIYLRAESVEEEYRAFLSQMTLTVMQDGESTLFSAPANEQGTIADNVCLGTFYSGANMDLIVKLNVPVEMDNEFQNRTGIINWVFTAEQFSINPTLPKTGDASNTAHCLLMSAVCSASLALLLSVKRIKKALSFRTCR